MAAAPVIRVHTVIIILLWGDKSWFFGVVAGVFLGRLGHVREERGDLGGGHVKLPLRVKSSLL